MCMFRCTNDRGAVPRSRWTVVPRPGGARTLTRAHCLWLGLPSKASKSARSCLSLPRSHLRGDNSENVAVLRCDRNVSQRRASVATRSAARGGRHLPSRMHARCAAPSPDGCILLEPNRVEFWHGHVLSQMPSRSVYLYLANVCVSSVLVIGEDRNLDEVSAEGSLGLIRACCRG